MTVYVQRDGGGAITGVYALPQPGLAEEEIAEDAPAVVAYLHPTPPTAEELLAQVRAEALSTLLTRADVTSVSARAVFDAVTTSINDRLTFLFAQAAALAGTTPEALEAEFGRPARVLAPEILAYIAANPTAGDPAPA